MEKGSNSFDSSDEVLVECADCSRRFAGVGLAGSRCPECMGELLEIARARPDERLEEKVVEVFRATDWVQAELLREYLEAQGTIVAFRTAAPWGVLTFTVDGMGEVAILALESEADRARGLIDEYLQKIETETTDTDEEEES